MPVTIAKSHRVPSTLPVIPGYKVIASPDYWLMAERGGLLFYVNEHELYFELWPQVKNYFWLEYLVATNRPVFVDKSLLQEGPWFQMRTVRLKG